MRRVLIRTQPQDGLIGTGQLEPMRPGLTGDKETIDEASAIGREIPKTDELTKNPSR